MNKENTNEIKKFIINFFDSIENEKDRVELISLINTTFATEQKRQDHPHRWKPGQNDGYWTIRSGIGAYNLHWYNDDQDKVLFSQRNVFKTKSEAEEYLRYLNIKARIMDIAESLGQPAKDDWKNRNITKYGIGYNWEEDEFILVSNTRINRNNIYSISKNFLDTCLDIIGKEDLKFYLTSKFY